MRLFNWKITVILFVLIAAVLFLFPFNFFDGEIVYRVGDSQIPIATKLSLSYFIGMGYETNDLQDVVDFYLTKNGYVFAATLLLGIPVLAGMIMGLRKQK